MGDLRKRLQIKVTAKEDTPTCCFLHVYRPREGRRYGRGPRRGCRGPEYTGVVTSSVTDPRVNGDEAYIGRAGLLTLVFVDIPQTK